MLTRRQFLKAGAITAVAGLSVGLYSWQVEPHWAEEVMLDLPVAGLPNALVGARLVQLSDLHAGPRVGDDYLFDVFGRVAELKPDILVVTGDLTHYYDDIFAHADRVFAQFPRGRLATLGVLGNHDYGPAWSHSEVATRLSSIFGEHGIRVLRNEIVDVAGVQIVGLDDLWGGAFEPAKALASIDAKRPMLALSHNPDTVDLPGWDGFSGWILAGHTHGGQVKPPFLPPPQLPVDNKRYTSGAFELSDNRRMYINRGVGYLHQVRFNARPEITVFKLTRA